MGTAKSRHTPGVLFFKNSFHCHVLKWVLMVTLENNNLKPHVSDPFSPGCLPLSEHSVIHSSGSLKNRHLE